jgi:large subunit ribosomal protein L19
MKMKQNKFIQAIEEELLKKDLPAFRVGDTLCVHTRIIEGEKERIQMFTGTVIARRGRGLSETVALYRVSYGSGMERVFLLHSPRIAKVEVVKSGKVRKSKLYHIRGASGKAAKVKEQIGGADAEAVSSEAAAT